MLDPVTAATVEMATATVCPARFSDLKRNLTQVNRGKNRFPKFFL